MGSGLHTALIQDPAMVRGRGLGSFAASDTCPRVHDSPARRNATFQAQGKPDNTIYDHGHAAFQRKGEGAPYGHASPGWPRGAPAADPLFPEPETAVPKPYNGSAARYATSQCVAPSV